MSDIDYQAQYIKEKDLALSLVKENLLLKQEFNRLKEEVKVVQCECKPKFDLLHKEVLGLRKKARISNALNDKTFKEFVAATEASKNLSYEIEILETTVEG
jgi:hypothetical protein